MHTIDALTLPSRCAPYTFNEVEMGNYSVKQIMLMSSASVLKSVAPMVEALNQVLNVDAATLTDGDFYYLQALQRLEVYTESPLEVNWSCTGTIFREKEGLRRVFTLEQLKKTTADWEAATEEQRADMTNPDELIVVSETCDKQNKVNIKMADLVVFQLEEKIKLPEGLDFPRVATLAEANALRTSPEYAGVVDAVRWIAFGDTIEEKLEYVTEHGLSLLEKAMQCNLLHRHGISRIIKKGCPSCGTESQHMFDITPDIFFQV